MRFFLTLASFIIVISLFFPSQAISCSRIGPENKTYISSNGEYRFALNNGSIMEIPFEETPSDIWQKLPSDNEPKKASGLLEKKTANDQWKTIWSSDLPNNIAPNNAIVSDDGQYVVTFGDWDGFGYGSNIIVIYDENGSLKRNISLEEFLPDYYINALPTSSCGRSWENGDAEINNNILSLNIIIPNNDINIRSQTETVEFLFDLDSGHISKKDTNSWINAMQKALAALKQQLIYEEQRIKYLNEPLLGKTVMDISEWHQYLRGAFSRVVDPNEISGTTVLFPKDHERYRESLKWVLDVFKDMADARKYRNEYIKYASMASSDPANLSDVLIQIASDYKKDELAASHLMVVIDPKYWNDIKNSFSHTKLQFSFIDPLKPISPSPDLLEKWFNPPPKNPDDSIFDL